MCFEGSGKLLVVVDEGDFGMDFRFLNSLFGGIVKVREKGMRVRFRVEDRGKMVCVRGV